MEQNSLPGKINISETTYQLVKQDFTCTNRGRITIKGKGEMDMNFVGGINLVTNYNSPPGMQAKPACNLLSSDFI